MAWRTLAGSSRREGAGRIPPPGIYGGHAHGGAEPGATVKRQAIPDPARLRIFRSMANATRKAWRDETVQGGFDSRRRQIGRTR